MMVLNKQPMRFAADYFMLMNFHDSLESTRLYQFVFVQAAINIRQDGIRQYSCFITFRFNHSAGEKNFELPLRIIKIVGTSIYFYSHFAQKVCIDELNEVSLQLLGFLRHNCHHLQYQRQCNVSSSRVKISERNQSHSWMTSLSQIYFKYSPF